MSDEPPPSPLAPKVSPLGEADPNSLNGLIDERIDDIFNRKPQLITDADLRFMVEYYQSKRLTFLQESQVKELKPKGQRRAAPTTVADALVVSTLRDTAELL